jgi:hypothetical protein
MGLGLFTAQPLSIMASAINLYFMIYLLSSCSS